MSPPRAKKDRKNIESAPETTSSSRVSGPGEGEADAQTGDDVLQALTLVIDNSEYAIPILRVREIASYGMVTPVPTTPTWIRGVMNLRGTVVPVVDLAVKLGLPQTTLTPRTCVVIVELPFGEDVVVTAVIVDGVNRVIDLNRDDIQEPPSFGLRALSESVQGLVRSDDDHIVLLLDIGHVIAQEDLRELDSEAIETVAG